MIVFRCGAGGGVVGRWGKAAHCCLALDLFACLRTLLHLCFRMALFNIALRWAWSVAQTCRALTCIESNIYKTLTCTLYYQGGGKILLEVSLGYKARHLNKNLPIGL